MATRGELHRSRFRFLERSKLLHAMEMLRRSAKIDSQRFHVHHVVQKIQQGSRRRIIRRKLRTNMRIAWGQLRQNSKIKGRIELQITTIRKVSSRTHLRVKAGAWSAWMQHLRKIGVQQLVLRRIEHRLTKQAVFASFRLWRARS